MKKSKVKIIFAFFALLVSLSLVFSVTSEKEERRSEYFTLCEKYAGEYSVPASLVKAVLAAESGFKSDARSSAGAVGLMQLMPSTFSFVSERYGIKGEDILDPETNVSAGCAYLDYLFSRFEDTETVLCAYNAGEGNVISWLSDGRYSMDGKTLSVIPFPETRNYVLKVMRLEKEYK